MFKRSVLAAILLAQVYVLRGDSSGTVERIRMKALDDPDTTGWRLHPKRLARPIDSVRSAAFGHSMRKNETYRVLQTFSLAAVILTSTSTLRAPTTRTSSPSSTTTFMSNTEASVKNAPVNRWLLFALLAPIIALLLGIAVGFLCVCSRRPW